MIEDCGFEGVVVTGDRDSLQLVSERITVKLITTVKGQTLTKNYTPESFKEEYGFEPLRIIDLKALMGDPSDNIPGVAGVGKKTAADLVQKFGKIADIYQNLEGLDISRSVKDKLAAGKDMAELSYELATIDRHVPVEIDISKIVLKPYDKEKLYKLFLRLEFKSLIEKLGLEDSANESSAPEEDDFQYSTERLNPHEWRLVLNAVTDTVAVVCQPGLHALAFHNDGKVYIARECDFEKSEYEKFLKEFFSEKIKKCGIDIKADLKQLLDLSIEAGGYVFDVALCAYLFNPAEAGYSIERLSLSYLSKQVPSPKEYEDESAFSPLSLRSGAEEAIAAHAAAVCRLYRKMKDQLENSDMKKLYYDLELPLCEVLASMEHIGMKVDASSLSAFSGMLAERIEQSQRAVYLYAGYEFNINSTKMLGEVLFEKLGLPPVKKTKSGYSTDIEVLEKLRGKHPIIEEIIEYRQLTKLKSTYADGLLKVIGCDGRIHTKFNMMATATGRLSSTDPNLQNIPIRQDLGSEIRKMFVAEEGYLLVDADYSQIELRVLAHIANDPAMIEAFKNGMDIHTITASQVFGVTVGEVTPELRRRAKAVNFGIVYGISDFSLAEDIGVTRAEARYYIDSYLTHYSGIREYMRNVVENARETGYVRTIMHRLRYLPELKSKNFNIRSFGERAAMNTPIQGSAADIIKMAMLRVHRRFRKEGLRSRLVLQVHDELVVEAPEEESELAARILKEEMENVAELRLPLVAEVSSGKTWYDAK